MAAEPTFVIAGAGLAGAKAAEALRGDGFAGRIVLIGAEEAPPYERPPLSKKYLQGAESRESIFVHDADWYTANAIETRFGTTVDDIDRDRKEVTASGGLTIPYDALLLTTGASPRMLRVPGADLDGVHYLRGLEDSDRIRSLLVESARIVIIGGGWIGLEVTAAARRAKSGVTVLEMETLPLRRTLGEEMAEVFAGLHRDHGVDLRLGVQVSEILGVDGWATGVRLGDGTIVDADAVIVGIGAVPNTGLAQAAGLPVDNGVIVDASLRTADPAVFAAGDVANAYHPLIGKHIRVEHWANALNQPATAARSMLGQGGVYDRVPYFYTDQYDLGMEYSGYVDPGGYDRVAVRGDLAAREFIAFWLRGGKVLAGMNVNVWDVTDPIQRLVRSTVPVDVERLTDPGVPLEDLLPAQELERQDRR